jgi:spermidine synthase
MGFLFTLGARLVVERGGAGGQAYLWESIGAVTGGALFSFVLIRWLDPFQTALLVASINLVVAASLWILRRLPSSLLPRQLYLLLILAPLLFGSLFLGRFLNEATLRWQWSDLAFAADSPYGRLIIQARDGQRAFYENGLLAFETQGTFAEEVVHFPTLAHRDPRNVLLIGGGVAGDLRELLKHPVDRVTYVELDPLLTEAAHTHLPPEDAALLDDPRVTLILSDGRLFVKESAKLIDGSTRPSLDEPTGSFDVVILDLPEPATGALNRFYTREFFEEARAILNPGGVLALGLPSAENYWSPELARRNGSVYHTLRAVFPEVLVLPGEHNFFLASELPLQAGPDALAERFVERGLETRWVTPEYIEYVFTTDRFAGVRQELEATAGVRLNRDLTPISYYYDLALWLSRFQPNLRGAFESASLVNLGWVTVPLALGVVWVRWRRGWAVPVAIGTIGLAGMMLEVAILFAFQVLHGYVYAEVSLILTAFMAGLALGAGASNRLLAGWSPVVEKRARQALIGVQLAGALCSLFIVILLRLSIPAPTVVFPLLTLLAGLLAGVAFPLAVSLVRNRGEAGQVTGTLYGVDLVGGCLGALLGAVLLIPLLGIPNTCVAVALVALAGLLALV